jgi:TetR/AcrR family transcriptional regulator, tetracycline repressor protein
MKVASPTATRVFLYVVHHWSTMACTAYSCQAMTAKQDTKTAPATAPKLSKAAVVERALALGDAVGLEALTIRRLAQDLGVTPMALYWHFRSKEELLAALGDRVWTEIDISVDPVADWSAQLRVLLESLVQMLRAHPCASQLLLSGEKLHGEASLLVTETALAVLARGGFDPGHASEVARGALWTALTLVMSEPGYDPAASPAERAEQQRQSQIKLAMLPPDRFPQLVAAAAPMTACDDPEFHYRFGVDRFIAGVVVVAPGKNAAPASQ